MNPVCCAIYDKKAQSFLAPYFYSNLAEAERAFIGLLARGDSTPAQWPEDFDLYHLGDYSPSSGALRSLDHPSIVITGQSAIMCLDRLRRNEREACKDNSKADAGAIETSPRAVAEGDNTKDSTPEFENLFEEK